MVNDFEVEGVIVSFKDEMAATLGTAKKYLAYAQSRTSAPLVRLEVERDAQYAVIELVPEYLPTVMIERLDKPMRKPFHAPQKTCGLLDED